MQLCWRIAQKTLSVEVPDPLNPRDWQQHLETHLVPYPDPAPDFHLILSPERGWKNPVTDYGVWFDSPPDSSSLRIRMERHDLSGVIVKKDGHYKGKLTINNDSPETLTVLLRCCISLLCEDCDEMLLHASGVIRKGRVWLFCGPAGSGKTTIAVELRDQNETFSVDRVVLRTRSDGHIEAHSTPFSDDTGIARSKQTGIVSGIAFIEKSADNKILSMGYHEIIRAILDETFALSRSVESQGRLIEIAGNLAQNAHCCRLKFQKDKSFWTLLNRFDTVAA